MSERGAMTDVRERIAEIIREEWEMDYTSAEIPPWKMAQYRATADRILACVREGEEPRAWAVEVNGALVTLCFFEVHAHERSAEHAGLARVVPLYAAPAPRGASGE